MFPIQPKLRFCVLAGASLWDPLTILFRFEVFAEPVRAQIDKSIPFSDQRVRWPLVALVAIAWVARVVKIEKVSLKVTERRQGLGPEMIQVEALRSVCN